MMLGRNATINSINEMEGGAVIVGDDNDTWGKDGGPAKRAETSDAWMLTRTSVISCSRDHDRPRYLIINWRYTGDALCNV